MEQSQERVAVINEIFGRFALIYESAWTDTIPTPQLEAVKRYEWATGLEGVTLQQAKRAIEICKRQFKWYPGICEFRNIALNIIPERTHHEAYQLFESVMFLPKKSNPEIAKKGIANMRAILAKAPK